MVELGTSGRVPTIAVEAPEAWRESVLRGMLTLAAIVVPLLAILGLFVGSTQRDPQDIAVLIFGGVAFPLLRFNRRLSIRQRALAADLVLFAVGLFLIARVGFAAGVSVVVVATCVFGVIILGRTLGFIMIGVSAVAHVFIGVLVISHVLRLAPREVDPLLFRNWLRMAASTSLIAFLLAAVIDFVIRHVEANARTATNALHQLRYAYERLGHLHDRLESTKEEERRFLARELHDELGQSLTALKLRLQLGARAPGGVLDGASHGAPHGAPDGAPDVLALIDQLITRVRRISVDLRPPLLDEVGLGPALRLYLEGQAALAKVEIALEVQEASGSARLAPELEIACFRVVQESITNALRHASARHIRVRLRRTDASVSLAIRDDGRGFDPETIDTGDASGHLGITGMRERVRARAGAFQLSSRPGDGTAIEIELPI
jgi:signal transduction histidine kinase